jgi:hypothetical protein
MRIKPILIASATVVLALPALAQQTASPQPAPATPNAQQSIANDTATATETTTESGADETTMHGVIPAAPS